MLGIQSPSRPRTMDLTKSRFETMTYATKKCSKCGEIKPLSAFYSKSGKCKPCFCAQTNARRRANPAAHREQNRKYRERMTSTDKAKWRRYYRDYRRANPPTKVKTAARNALNFAVGAGKVTKAVLCQFCGAHERLEGHHHDYARQLDVQWLCVPCHRQWHVTNGEGLNP